MSSPFLTISCACSMIWPGSQQPMGELLDQNKLSCKIREYIDGGNLPRNIDEAVADDSNPIKQARRNAAALKEFLDPDFNRNKEHAFVEPIVVWANPEIKVYRKKHLSEKAQREIIKKLESCY